MNKHLPGTFASTSTYNSLFPFTDVMIGELYKIAKEIVHDRWAIGSTVSILSIGYGIGQRDLMLVFAVLASNLSCKVTAVEPFWNSDFEAGKEPGAVLFAKRTAQVVEKITGKRFSVSYDHNVSPNQFVISDGINQANITIEQCRAEEYTYDEAIKYDVLLIINAMHLLLDWKCYVGSFLSLLKRGGVFIYGESAGDITAIDGAFRGVPPSSEWGKFWKKYYEERSDLLLPSLRLVAPKDMSFLGSVLRAIEFRDIDPEGTWIALEHHQCTNRDIDVLLENTELGADANTFGSLRILEAKRAKELSTLMRTALEKYTDTFSFSNGTRLVVFVNSEKERDDSTYQRFLTSVSSVAYQYSTGFAIEVKTATKFSLSRRIKALKEKIPLNELKDLPTGLNEIRDSAIGKVLFEMREALCLTRDSLVVATSRVEGKYSSVVNLLPESILGAFAGKRAASFNRTHTEYLSVDNSMHVSSLYETELPDMSVSIRFLNAQESTEDARPRYWRSAEGMLTHLHIGLEVSKKEEFERLLFPHILNSKINQLGYDRQYDSFQSAAPNKSTHSYTELDSQVLATIASYFKGKLTEVPQVYLEPLSTALAKSVRLSLWDILNDREKQKDQVVKFQTAVFVMRRQAIEKQYVGAAFLLLLDSSDHDAWIAPDLNMVTENNTKHYVPRLIAALEAFVSSVVEIQMTSVLDQSLRAKSESLPAFLRRSANRITPPWFVNENRAVSHDYNQTERRAAAEEFARIVNLYRSSEAGYELLNPAQFDSKPIFDSIKQIVNPSGYDHRSVRASELFLVTLFAVKHSDQFQKVLSKFESNYTDLANFSLLDSSPLLTEEQPSFFDAIWWFASLFIYDKTKTEDLNLLDIEINESSVVFQFMGGLVDCHAYANTYNNEEKGARDTEIPNRARIPLAYLLKVQSLTSATFQLTINENSLTFGRKPALRSP
jgi:SAM-dependent methyltransferase